MHQQHKDKKNMNTKVFNELIKNVVFEFEGDFVVMTSEVDEYSLDVYQYVDEEMEVEFAGEKIGEDKYKEIPLKDWQLKRLKQRLNSFLNEKLNELEEERREEEIESIDMYDYYGVSREMFFNPNF